MDRQKTLNGRGMHGMEGVVARGMLRGGGGGGGILPGQDDILSGSIGGGNKLLTALYSSSAGVSLTSGVSRGINADGSQTRRCLHIRRVDWAYEGLVVSVEFTLTSR